MVYIGNILIDFNELTDDYELILHFKSGASRILKKDDKVFKSSGDLVIERLSKTKHFGGIWARYVIDTAEIEFYEIKQKEKIV